MEKTEADSRDISWNFYSCVILLLFSFLQVLHWKLFPKFLDIYYHLSVISGFADAGGYVTRAFWEYAPFGRPHLYPPLAHILMLLLYKIGFSKLFIARLFSCLIYPAILFVIWQLVKRIFNPRLAFFILLVCSSSFGLYLSIINLIPFGLCIICGLLILFCVEAQKTAAAALLTGLTFYTHTQAAWLIILWIILYGLFNRARFKICLKSAAFGLLLAIPMLFHQFYNRKYFEFIDAMENYSLDINLLIYILAVFGVFIAFIRKGAYFLFISIFFGMFPLFFTHQLRYFSGMGLLGFSFLAGLSLEAAFQKVSRRADICRKCLILACPVWVFYFFSPGLYINREEKSARLGLFDTTLANALKGPERQFRSTELSIYYPKYEDEVVKIVEENSQDDDIIWSDLSYFAGLVSLFAHRATSTAMLAEVKSYANFDRIGVAKLAVFLKEPEYGLSVTAQEIVKEYALELVKEAQIAYIYRNPRVTAKRVVSKPFLPNAALFFIFFIYIGLIIYLGLGLQTYWKK
ncbi:MAG: hypothetical protein NC914_03200 [Candidatus Omnitrophica bacterium]|nr:hypothetical protein [Candidatus Omnitrophota bacterium]